MKVLIIGVDHHYQTGSAQCSKEDIQGYISVIESLVKQHSVTYIYEEMNDEGLEKYGVKSTLAQNVTAKHGIKHMFVDPTELERKHLGIMERGRIKIKGINNGLSNNEIDNQITEQDIKRENYWASRILKIPEINIIFICGSYHSERFLKLLLTKDMEAKLVYDDWKP